jgi:LysR family nitrogen assimilation transcriptional regulator
MDVKQLRTLVAIAESGSVMRAAVLLNIVQPAVSRHLKMLEDDLGTSLFERSHQGMALTEAGYTLLDYARRVLAEVERARAEIKPSKGTIGGIVTIGMLSSTSDLVSHLLLQTIRADYPGIQLRFLVAYSGDLQRWLETGEVDATLLYDTGATAAMKVRPLLEEGLCIVDRPQHIVRQDVAVPFSFLAEVPLILPNAPHGLRGLVDHEAALNGLRLDIIAETNAMRVQKSLVAAGHGLTILPANAVNEDVNNGLLVSAPLAAPALTRKIVLALPTNRPLRTPVRVVVSSMVNSMRQAVLNGIWKSAIWLDSES